MTTAARETAFTAQPGASAGGRVIASPFQYMTTGEDSLRIVSSNALPGVRVKVQARRYSPEGQISAAMWDHIPASDRSIVVTDYALGVGALLNLTVYASSGSPTIGQTFVMVQIIRGQGAAAIVLGTMLAGYVTATQHLGWPGSPVVSSTEGQGCNRLIQGTTPALGTDFNEVVPTGARWRLISILFGLNCSVTVATRYANLLIGLSGFHVFASAVPDGCTAGTTHSLGFGGGVGVSYVAATQFHQGPVPQGVILPAAGRIRSLTANLQANDSVSAPNYCVEEWLEV